MKNIKRIVTAVALILVLLPSYSQEKTDNVYEFRFITKNHTDDGDYVTVRFYVPVTVAVKVEEKTSIQTVDKTTLQSFSLRANLLRLATLTPDLGIEWQFARRWSVAVDGSWTSWSRDNKNRRYALWEVSPEVRYCFTQNNKFYLGVQYKIGEFNYKLSNTGKQGDLQGGGITFGYKLPLGKRFALDFNAAAGCLHADYETYHVADGVRVKEADHTKNVWGVTDLGITLVWKLK
jgi:hypothetical protein